MLGAEHRAAIAGGDGHGKPLGEGIAELHFDEPVRRWEPEGAGVRVFTDDGDYHARERTAGADVDVCFGGRIAVTLIKLL